MTAGIEIIAVPETSAPACASYSEACDAHSHVFGPFARFPPVQPSVYPLPDALPAAHAQARGRLGMARAVLVQPAPYADDPSAMLNAISGAPEALRGVAVATEAIADGTLQQWRAGGIVGLRFVEMRAPNGARYPGSVGFETLIDLAPRMRRAGLHAQLWASAKDIAKWLPKLSPLGITLVLDHMACPDVGEGASGASFQSILDYGADCDLWVKLTLCRASKAPGYGDVRPFHDRLLTRFPERLVWGSDWPYVRMSPSPDAGAMLDKFYDWTPDDELRRRILVANPARLYNFERVIR